jgi:hypothetical protein
MSGFTYNRGNWSDGMPLAEWDEDEDGGEYQKRIGYCTTPAATFGHEHAGQIEIFEHSSDKSFYAHVCPNGAQVFEVFLPDFPSMMMFIKDYAAAFATESSNTTQQQTFDLLEKLFRVQHGHSSHAICAKCDPDAWAERQRKLREG